MEENEAEVAETANEFEIFDNFISIISSADALTNGLPSHQTAAVNAVKTITQKISKEIGFVPDQFELLNAISGLIWMYGEARAAFARAEEKENKEELAKHARQVKDIASRRINQIISLAFKTSITRRECMRGSRTSSPTPPVAGWLDFDGQRWKRGETGAALDCAMDVARNIMNEVSTNWGTPKSRRGRVMLKFRLTADNRRDGASRAADVYDCRRHA